MAYGLRDNVCLRQGSPNRTPCHGQRSLGLKKRVFDLCVDERAVIGALFTNAC